MNPQLKEKLVNFLIITASLVMVLLIVYVFFTSVFAWILPFVLAYAISLLINPLVDFLEMRLRFPRKLASLVSIIFSLTFVGSAIALIVNRIYYELRSLSEKIPGLYDIITAQVNEIFISGMNFYVALPLDITQYVDNVIRELTGTLTSFLRTITGFTTKSIFNIATSIPLILVFLIVLLLSTYFMSSDKEKISKALSKVLPQNLINRTVDIKNDLIFALFGYIKAQLILMSVTFIIVSLGLYTIGVEYAVVIALLISLIDALPIVGTGSVFVPWVIINVILGNYTLALYLLILYGLAFVARQMLEPKVLGGQIGLHPLVTLMSMYIGLRIFGVLGMIVGPVTTLFIRNLYRSGIIDAFKK